MERNELRTFTSLYLQNKMKNVYVPVDNDMEEYNRSFNIKSFARFNEFRKSITMDIMQKFNDRFIKAMDNDNSSKKVIIVYHGVDIDGLGIRVLAEVTKRIGGFKEILYIPCDKRADEAWEQISTQIYDYDLCIIADLNFTDEFVDKINGNLNTDNIILLDHHKHALSLNNESWAYVKEHDIYNNILSSGTMLFYTLIEPYIAYTLNNRSDYEGDMVEDIFRQLDEFVLCTAAHDTWFAHDINTEDLSLEIFDKMPLYLSLIHKTYKEDYADKCVENILYSYKLIDGNDMILCKTTNDIIQHQCTFMWHNCKIYKKDNLTIALCYITQYSSEIGNYILKKQPEVDFVLMINPNVESISLRSRTDKYDVSTLAKQMNGGGHQAASGFTIPSPGVTYKYFNKIDLDIISNLLDGNEFMYKYECETSLFLTPIKQFEYDKDTKKYNIK